MIENGGNTLYGERMKGMVMGLSYQESFRLFRFFNAMVSPYSS